MTRMAKVAALHLDYASRTKRRRESGRSTPRATQVKSAKAAAGATARRVPMLGRWRSGP